MSLAEGGLSIRESWGLWTESISSSDFLSWADPAVAAITTPEPPKKWDWRSPGHGPPYAGSRTRGPECASSLQVHSQHDGSAVCAGSWWGSAETGEHLRPCLVTEVWGLATGRRSWAGRWLTAAASSPLKAWLGSSFPWSIRFSFLKMALDWFGSLCTILP